MNKKNIQIVTLAAAVFLLLLAALTGPDPSGSVSGTVSSGKKAGGSAADISPGAAPGGPGAVLSGELFSRKQKETVQEPFSAEDVRFRGAPAACDEAAAAVYIPCGTDFSESGGEGSGEQPESTEGSGELPEGRKDSGESPKRRWENLLAGLLPAEEGDSLFYEADSLMEDPEEAVRTGHAFHALLSSPERTVLFDVILTGLPAVCIVKTDEEEIVRKEDHSGIIRVISVPDPAQRESPKDASHEEEELLCRFHVRGNVSATLKKKPYKISLLAPDGSSRKAAFLGLRRDDDWILNPLYTDHTRVREKTAYALWDETAAFSRDPVPSSRMQYVELFLDNEYQGIYGLMEPVDRKQTGLSEGDLLYKIDRWDREYPYLDLYEEKEEAKETQILNDNGFPCVEIRYPKTWDSTATWKPMEAYHAFSFRNHDPEALSREGLTVDMDSVLRLCLFCAMTHGMDNNWKNTFLIARKSADGYQLRRTVWDLNYVFGDVFVYEPEAGYTAFDRLTACVWVPCRDTTFDYEAFLLTDPSLKTALSEKWRAWREGGISAEAVCALAGANLETLRESGALAREKALWSPGQDPEEAFEEMDSWIRERFEFLDRFLGYP